MKQFQKDPINDNILDTIQAGDEVAFKGDTTIYVYQNKGDNRSETSGNYWFRPKGQDRGFTIPRPLFAAMEIVTWFRPQLKQRYQVEVVKTVTEKRYVDAYDLDDLRATVHSNSAVMDFEVLENKGDVDPSNGRLIPNTAKPILNQVNPDDRDRSS